VLHLAAVPLGFDPDEVLLATVDTRRASIAAETRPMLYERLVTAVFAVPGVEHAAASTSVPIRRGVGVLGVSTAQMPNARQTTLFNFVSPQWFATYGIALVAGRDFDGRDSANAAPVVIINETLARLVFPGREPLGERVLTQAPNWQPLTVVGVVGDAVSHSLRGTQAGSALRDPVAPMIYVPLAQAEGLRPPGASEITISVRPRAGSASRLAASVGASLTSVDAIVSFTFRPLADVVSAAFTQERLVAMLSGVFGSLALCLAGIGLYGVSSYAMSRRRTEIGVRIALGATPRSVVRLILRRVAILTGLGIIGGAVLSRWVLQVVSSFLFGLSPDDPATLFAAILTVSAVGVAAGWFPAWRAGRIEPVEVLREH
jgi:putative ABC transport system permease protein